MKSPFKFLDAYNVDDKEVFFGRDDEVDTLYGQIFKTPLMLVYGLSGTGKTSIIQCGLANKFDGPDWYPFFVRRNTNINLSTKYALEQALQEDASNSITDNVSLLLKKYLRPVYLIFDQFEELFILGSRAEQDEFMAGIEDLLSANLPCKIIFVMREEYIAQLYPYEKKIPTLFDFRLRIERMGISKIKEVITSSFEQFNVNIAPPAEANVQKMVDNINDDRTGIALPYLQVYLDLLYKEAYKAKSPEDSSLDETYPALTIQEAMIDGLGKIDDVLNRFLAVQERQISVDMYQNFPVLPERIVNAVLSGFVTQDGTKRPINYFRDDGMIKISDADAQFFPQIPKEALTHCLEQLEHARLIRIADDDIELAHDSLAALIDGRRTDEERRLQEVRQRVLNSFEEYKESKAFLNEKQLNTIEDLVPFLNLNQEVLSFIEDSKQNVLAEKLEAEALRRKEREAKLMQEKYEAEQKARKKNRTLFRIALGAAAAALAMGGFAVYEGKEAIRLKNEAVQVQGKLEDTSQELIKATDHLVSASDAMSAELIKKDSILKTLGYDPQGNIGQQISEQQEIENFASISKPTNYFFLAGKKTENESQAQNTFRVGQYAWYSMRINAPKSEVIHVICVDANNEFPYEKYHTVATNTGNGYRIRDIMNVRLPAGTYKVSVLNGNGTVIGSQSMTFSN
ncbi:MAG: hypothetical protein KTR13_10680 [Saprospiraceae bacterium]|nr:hypothetical protein [Saprospiraceae bacterium]